MGSATNDVSLIGYGEIPLANSLCNFAYTVLQMTDLQLALPLAHPLARMLKGILKAEKKKKKREKARRLKKPRLVPCAQRTEHGLLLKAPDERLPLLSADSHYIVFSPLITPIV